MSFTNGFYMIFCKTCEKYYTCHPKLWEDRSKEMGVITEHKYVEKCLKCLEKEKGENKNENI